MPIMKQMEWGAFPRMVEAPEVTEKRKIQLGGVLPRPAVKHARRHVEPTVRVGASRVGKLGFVGSDSHAMIIVGSSPVGVKQKIGKIFGQGPDRTVKCGALESYAPAKKYALFPPSEVDTGLGPYVRDMVTLLSEFARTNALTAEKPHVRHNVASVTRLLRGQHILYAQGITRPKIALHLAELLESGLSRKTVKNHQGAISRFCEFLVDKDLLRDNPCRKLHKIRLEKRPPLFLDEREYAQALKIARQHGIYAEVCLALHTGMRMSELRRLRWEDVDLSRRVVLVRKSKGKRFRLVPLNRKAITALRYQRRKTGQYPYVFAGGRGDKPDGKGTWGKKHPRTVHWWASEALKPLQARIPKFGQMPKGSVGRGWHLFRHTFATRCIRSPQSIPIAQVSKWLGHRAISTTELYAHAQDGYSELIERL